MQILGRKNKSGLFQQQSVRPERPKKHFKKKVTQKISSKESMLSGN